MRLKPNELKQHRLQLLEQQDYKCPLCGSHIIEDEAALDHDHDDGKIRAVLHRSCNQAEGRIKSWIKRSRFEQGGDHTVFIRNLLEYLEADYSTAPEHPTHLTQRCKRFNALRKDLQIEKLRELQIVLEGKETKKQLTKLYRNAIK